MLPIHHDLVRVAFSTPRPDSTGELTLFEAAHFNFDVGVDLRTCPVRAFPTGFACSVPRWISNVIRHQHTASGAPFHIWSNFLASVPCARLQTAQRTEIAAGIVGAVVIGRAVSLATSTILLHVASWGFLWPSPVNASRALNHVPACPFDADSQLIGPLNTHALPLGCIGRSTKQTTFPPLVLHPAHPVDGGKNRDGNYGGFEAPVFILTWMITPHLYLWRRIGW